MNVMCDTDVILGVALASDAVDSPAESFCDDEDLFVSNRCALYRVNRVRNNAGGGSTVQQCTHLL